MSDPEGHDFFLLETAQRDLIGSRFLHVNILVDLILSNSSMIVSVFIFRHASSFHQYQAKQ